MLKNGGSPEHAEGVQRYFKQEIKSHGWYSGDLRRAAVQVRREILDTHDLNSLQPVLLKRSPPCRKKRDKDGVPSDGRPSDARD
jgi:DNA alkylation repair enzyme